MDKSGGFNQRKDQNQPTFPKSRDKGNDIKSGSNPGFIVYDIFVNILYTKAYDNKMNHKSLPLKVFDCN